MPCLARSDTTSPAPRRWPSRLRQPAWITIASIVALAAALRLVTLGRWSLWIDEAFTLHDAFGDVPSYPLGYWLTRAAVSVLGDDEYALRLLPCSFGIATVALLALPGGSGSTGTRHRLAALLLALSSWHLFWSQSARYYAPLICFILVVARALEWRRIVTTRRRRVLLLLVACIAGALALSCHPTAAFFAPGAALSMLPGLGRRARRWLALAVVAALVAAIAWYGPLLPVHLRFKGPPAPGQLLASYGFQAGPLLLATGVLGLATAWQNSRPRLELCFGVLPGLGFLIASFQMFVTGYHAIATLPFAMLLAARGALVCRAPFRSALIAALVLEQLAGLVLYHASHGMRPRYREAAAAVRADPGAAVYATQEAPLAYYLASDRRILRDTPAARPLDDPLLDDLEAAVGKSGIVWVIVHVDDLHDWPPDARTRFERLVAGASTLVLPGSFGPKPLTLTLHRLR